MHIYIKSLSIVMGVLLKAYTEIPVYLTNQWFALVRSPHLNLSTPIGQFLSDRDVANLSSILLLRGIHSWQRHPQHVESVS